MSFIAFENFHDNLATNRVAYEGDLRGGWH